MEHKRVALVTGANQGIGYHVAKELAADGVTVVIGARDLRKGKEAAETIGSMAVAVELDVTDQATIDAAAAFIKEQFGRLDLLVNNAAISMVERGEVALEDYGTAYGIATVPIDKIRRLWETNVFGQVAVYQAMLPLLRRSSDARIVNVGSAVGSLTTNANPDFPQRKYFGPGYAGSKAAFHIMALSMIIEHQDDDIKVNLVSPGFTNTALNNNRGTDSIEDGAAEVVRAAKLGPDGASGTFTIWENQQIPW